MVSVIVRSRNEERYIGHCIQSITDLVGKPQIIIVDNESTDGTIPIVNRFEYHDVSKLQINKNDYTPGKSLNMGVNECNEDYVMILSAHCEIIKFNFNKMKSKLDSNGVGAIWGKQTPIWDGKKISRRYMWSNFGDDSQTNYWCESEDRYFFHNAFSMFRTSYLKKYPFDEHYSGKEDRYWANNQIENGFDIYYDSEQEVKHHYTPGGATWMGTG
jgi:rhamnosyltransferase|tara:strand:+ start:3176 stop:3820 length:645 start_codon:yes stop_codon:yes gene_type:complete